MGALGLAALTLTPIHRATAAVVGSIEIITTEEGAKYRVQCWWSIQWSGV